MTTGGRRSRPVVCHVFHRNLRTALHWGSLGSTQRVCGEISGVLVSVDFASVIVVDQFQKWPHLEKMEFQGKLDPTATWSG